MTSYSDITALTSSNFELNSKLLYLSTKNSPWIWLTSRFLRFLMIFSKKARAFGPCQFWVSTHLSRGGSYAPPSSIGLKSVLRRRYVRGVNHSKILCTRFVISLISFDFTWFHLISLDFTDFNWFHLVSLISLISLDFTWFHLISLDFTWFHHGLLKLFS